jgi:hypothetical protein
MRFLLLLGLAALLCSCGKDNPSEPQDQQPGAVSFSLQPAITLSTLWSTLVAGDFDHDGNTDLAASSNDSLLIYVLLGHGDGSFAPPLRVPMPAAATLVPSLTAGDWDDDGKLDIAANCLGTVKTIYLYGRGDGSFDLASMGGTPNLAQTPATGDFNGDGIDDYVGQRDDSVAVILGGLARVHTRVVSYVPPAPMLSGGEEGVAADLDGNGAMDFVVGGNTTTKHLFVYYGHGDGTFQVPVTPADAGYDLGVCSMRRPGGAIGRDLAVVHSDTKTVGVVRGGSGGFSAEVTYPVGSGVPEDVGAADFNQDGVDDLAVTNYGAGSVAVLLGRSDGSFEAAAQFGAGSPPGRLVTADFNNDGLTDMATVGFDSIRLLLNTSK